MHGLVNRSIQCFIRDSYGEQPWQQILSRAGIDVPGFEPMLVYPDDQTSAIIEAAVLVLDKAPAEFLEDLGTYIVSHEHLSAVRRLLRFGGETFTAFLHSLDDLPDRARMAVPDLEMPNLTLRQHTSTTFSLLAEWKYTEFSHVIVGVLRAMADEYGALVFLDHQGGRRGEDVISITLFEAQFSQGREFALSPVSAEADE